MHPDIFPPKGLLREFETLLPCCLSIRLFYYDLSVPRFCSKIVLPRSHPVVGMTSPILPQLVGRIFFRIFRKPVLSVFFGLPSFASIFWLVSLNGVFHSRCRAFSASFEYIFMLRLVFLCVVVVFLATILIWVPIRVLTFCLQFSVVGAIFSQTNFAPV